MIEIISPARTLCVKGETAAEHMLWADSLRGLCFPLERKKKMNMPPLPRHSHENVTRPSLKDEKNPNMNLKTGQDQHAYHSVDAMAASAQATPKSLMSPQTQHKQQHRKQQQQEQHDHKEASSRQHRINEVNDENDTHHHHHHHYHHRDMKEDGTRYATKNRMNEKATYDDDNNDGQEESADEEFEQDRRRRKKSPRYGRAFIYIYI